MNGDCEEASTAGRHRLIADRAMTYAARSEDPVAQAAAVRSLGILLWHEGRQAVAQRLTIQSGAKLDRAGLTTPAQTAAYVQTLCTIAYNARWPPAGTVRHSGAAG